MKEKISMVQLTKDQEKEVKGSAPEVGTCDNPEYWPRCRCRFHVFPLCASAGWICP